MKYTDTLNPSQINNASTLIARMKLKGITNQFTQAAILAIVSKESSFIPHSESSYAHTPNDRIRLIFGHLKVATDDTVNHLKADDKAFFNAVYGGMNGNTNDNAYLYVGRGFNQITFYNAYKKIGDEIGVDLISHPERLNEPIVAADALIQYFKDFFIAGAKLGVLKQYNTVDLNGFTNVIDAVNCVYHANAGWGHTRASINADPTGGKAKATSRVGDLLEFVKEHSV